MKSVMAQPRGSPDRWVRRDGRHDPPHLQIRLLHSTGTAVAHRGERAVRHGCGGRRPGWRHPAQGTRSSASCRTYQPGSIAAHPHRPALWITCGRRCSTGKKGRRCPPQAARRPTTYRTCSGCICSIARMPAARCTRSGERFDRNLHKPIDVDFGNTDGLHGVHDIHLNQGNTGPHCRRQRRPA